jgi:AsmA protein
LLPSLRKPAWIALGLLGLLLAAVLVVPHFVDLGRFKRTYLPRVEEALDRRLDVGEVRLSLVPTPAIRVSKLKVFDRPNQAATTFFAAEQVRLRLRLWPLLKGRFEVSELVLDKPIFNFFRHSDGTFNDADSAGKKTGPSHGSRTQKRAEAKTPDSTAMPLLVPGNVSIRDGQFNLVTKGQTTLNVGGIDLSLREFSHAAPFPFRASFSYPGLKTVVWEGKLDYLEEKASVELGDNRLRINDLTFRVRGGIDHLSGTPRLSLDTQTDNADAKSILQVLSVLGVAPRDTEMVGPMDVSLNVAGPANGFVTRISSSFKDVNVLGKRTFKGRLSGAVSIRLPMGGAPASRRLQGDGRLVVKDGELTHAELIRKIERVTGMIGLSKNERRQAATFEKMEADFILGGGYAEFTRLYLINPQVEVRGDGTMTLERPTLDVAISTALSTQASARAGRGRMTNYFKDKQGRIVVPLKIHGPLENPSVDLNAGKIANTGLPQNVEKGFSSFFKRLFRGR